MDATFEVFWGAVNAALSEATHVRNWTVDRRYTGKDFNAISVGKSIHCDPPGVNVSKEDFWKIWQVWEEYLAGEIKRQELRDLPHYNTKYVISILHYFMEKAE
jgi:hypothetical protein